jgi:hypothetical protein
MPAVSRWLLGSAATALLLGVALGLVLLVRRELVGAWPHPHLVSAHAHLVLVGSVMPTIAGVALWMFPLPRRDAPRPAPWLAWGGWLGLGPGTLLRALAEGSRAGSDAAVLRWLVVIGGALQVVGMALVLLALRGRVRAAGAGHRAVV